MISFSKRSRDAARAAQHQVAPGDGLVAKFDRGAWAAGGGRRAGEFRVALVLPFLILFPVALYLVGLDLPPIIGGTVGYSILIGRGFWVNERYRARAGGS